MLSDKSRPSFLISDIRHQKHADDDETGSILEVSSPELAEWMVDRGFPASMPGKSCGWVFQRRVEQFASMSDLPKALREQLEAEWQVFATEVAYHHVSPDGTDKLLWAVRTAGGSSAS